MKSNPRILLPVMGLILAGLLHACSDTPTPKPRSWFRIDLPTHSYQVFDSTYPYLFEYPVYARLVPRTGVKDEVYWMNIEFPGLKGTVYLSYKALKGDFARYMEDTRTLVNKHIPRSSGIEETLLENPDAKVYGSLFEIRGSESASTLQFFLTDSTRHFVRGALYFDAPPNNDSLKPVIDHVRADIHHLMETFRWSDKPLSN